jgi:hypothetical protein
MIEIYKLTKDRKKVRIKQLDLTKFEKIGTTGDGLALKYEKGKTIYIFTENNFDRMLERQEYNRKLVENQCYSYARIDENKSSSKQNTKRDEKGRPIKIYEELIDYHSEIKHLDYVNDTTFNEIYNYAKAQNKLYLWRDGWKNEE